VHPEDKIPVRVTIAGKLLPLKVAPQDEEIVRLAARLLNKRMEDFRAFHTGDETDRLAWAALDYTGDLLRLKNEKITRTDGVAEELQAIEELLKSY
jgi:cell division protein ZapA (FtsZ GTPase activity inhibitor)